MNLTMEQVREMDNYALQRLVGELLGWHIEHEEHKFQEFVIYRESFIVRPDGSKFNPQVIDKYLEQELISALPDWVECLDDAVELFNGEQVHAFTLSGLHDFGWSAVICDHKDMKYIEHDRMPARAVVLAWIAWKLNQ